MKRVAIIGSGIAGLSCAYFLKDQFNLTLFEKNDYVGGHTNTVSLDHSGESVTMDTGFMVFNKVTYPNLTRFFEELGVQIKPTSMSFSVQHLQTGLEFSGTSLNHLFAQRKNLLRPRFWRMLSQINRFNKEAAEALATETYARHRLDQYVQERGYGDDFRDFYLIPMASAVWSTSTERMMEFPALTLIRFFHNHGFLGLHTQHQWFTVSGGARSYVRKVLAQLKSPVRINSEVRSVRRDQNGVQLRTADGSTLEYDKVIFASHADHTLRMLEDADADERRLLGAFGYQPNLAIVHTDESVMPKSRMCWSSWNYRITQNRSGTFSPSTIYWMNSLQGVSNRMNYFVSINGEEFIAPDKVLRRIEYEHPLFNQAAVDAQREIPTLNKRSKNQSTYFCGGYFKYGFHEDAFTSGLELSKTITGGRVW